MIVLQFTARRSVAFQQAWMRTMNTLSTQSPPIANSFIVQHNPFSRSLAPLTSIRRYSITTSTLLATFDKNEQDEILESGYRRPVIHWYPGHIAKAERQLAETLRAVDVVVEVRDARACKATAHPRVGEWCAGRPRIVVVTHADMIPSPAVASWQRAYETFGAERWDDAPLNSQVANQASMARQVRFEYSNTGTDGKTKKKKKHHHLQPRDNHSETKGMITPVEDVLFVNAKHGFGIRNLHRAIAKAGEHVQERRVRRGLKTRPIRVGVIGYPNVGKSALINKILGRNRAKTANTPGITRTLQWIRVASDDTTTAKGKDFELLDSPGIIPARMVDQSDALLLAACNCIGQGAYDNQGVAAYLCEWLKSIHLIGRDGVTAPQWRNKCEERYKFDPLKPNEDGEYITGDEMIYIVADNTCQGDPEDASRKILQDFRTGRMGPIALQLAPETEEDQGQYLVRSQQDQERQQRSKEMARLRQQEKEEKARQAMETAKEQGLELPPMVEEGGDKQPKDVAVGAGLFEGW